MFFQAARRRLNSQPRRLRYQVQGKVALRAHDVIDFIIARAICRAHVLATLASPCHS